MLMRYNNFCFYFFKSFSFSHFLSYSLSFTHMHTCVHTHTQTFVHTSIHLHNNCDRNEERRSKKQPPPKGINLNKLFPFPGFYPKEKLSAWTNFKLLDFHLTFVCNNEKL